MERVTITMYFHLFKKVNSWGLQSLANVIQTRGNRVFVGDYFQQRINTHLVL